MPTPTWTEAAGITTALTLLLGSFGRGVVWVIQWQSARTTRALRDENAWLEAENDQLYAENQHLRRRLRNLGITP